MCHKHIYFNNSLTITMVAMKHYIKLENSGHNSCTNTDGTNYCKSSK
uniref:Uncharacterized protein n=1 Tax=Arundo donax TaxID=35708 RepID=A0A0A9AQ36_ARUDO